MTDQYDVPEPLSNEAMTWGFNEKWETTKITDMPEIWNDKHGDIFIINDDDDIQEGLSKIQEAYDKHKIG